MIIASLATFEERYASLPAVVESLAVQCNQVHIYLNDFLLPEDSPINNRNNVVVYNSPLGDLSDRGKWYLANVKSTHIRLLCDDDFIYPPDYAATMISHVERLERKAVVGYHGEILKLPSNSFYRDRKVYRWRVDLAKDVLVHILGTGCLAFPSELVSMPLEFAELPDMLDIWLGAWCQQHGIPQYCVPHAGRHLQWIPYDNTIWGRYVNDDALQTRLVNSVAWTKK